MKITIVRHTSVKCTADVCYGLSDVEVADSFETEAQQVKEMLINRTFEHVYSSPLTRCRKLAAYCGYDNPQTDARLLELNFGDWEGTRWDEITDPNLQRWYADWINECPTNGESFAAQVARVKLFLEQLKAEKKDKEHQNLGTLQRVLLTQYLSKKLKIDLSDLGPGYDYKLALGAKEYTREAFLKRVGLYQG